MSRKPPPPDPAPLAPLIDAHTHLAACGGRDAASVTAICDHAQSVGVAAVVTVADDIVDARWAVAAAQWDERVWAATAIHPTHASDLNDDIASEIAQMARHPRVVAVGETGLDYYWLNRSDDCAPKNVQREAFSWHIALAKEVDKPLMIHNRDASADLLDVLAADGSPDKVMMHSFSGDEAIARKCVDRGYLVSLSGTVSFTNAPELAAAARIVPVEQLLVETDAPFLTPHPYRGARNESYCLPYTVRALAAIRGEDDRELAHQLTANAQNFFGFTLPTP